MDRDIKQISQQLLNLYKSLEDDSQSGKLPLADSALDIVPGEGPSTAEVIFIGEAPGAQEQIDRRPFVGRSGKLFRKILEEESEIQPEQIYISNIVKARPPDNRDPSIEELAAYKIYLDKEIEILKPELIVTLGRFSMAKFLPNVKISQVHGKLHKAKWDGGMSYVLPMYHPAAALRATKTKNAFIEDFKKIPKIIPWIKEQKEKDQKHSHQPKQELTHLQKEFAKSDQSDKELDAWVVEHFF
jgi:uracil-DNA glycosylase family 4